jgi:uncharacterized linocin/CFP29 family protein
MNRDQMVDALVFGANGGTSYGNVAQRLLANGFNISSLRTNDVLRKDEWLLYDKTVVEVARSALVGVADLMGANLSLPIPNAMGVTSVLHETMSDMTPANISMTGLADGERDRLAFAQVNVPLPIIHKDFYISLRNLESSRRFGMPLDTSQASVAARRVSDAIEDMLFNGVAITSGGGTIYGYTNFTSRNTASVTAAWATTTGDNVLKDTLAMIAALQADNMYGPYMLYVTVAAYNNLLSDFKAASDKTILQRLLEIPLIRGVRATTRLTANAVVMVQFSSDVIDMLDGIQPTTVMWESNGGMMLNFKVLAIMAPRIKADQGGQCGVAHFS